MRREWTRETLGVETRWAEWLKVQDLPLSLTRVSRPRRTRLKGNPMSQSNAVVSSVPVQVRRGEG